jgi:hypothetical protein
MYEYTILYYFSFILLILGFELMDGLMLTGWVIYHLSHSTSPFLSWVFLIYKVFQSMPRLASNCYPLDFCLPSKILGISHWHLALINHILFSCTSFNGYIGCSTFWIMLWTFIYKFWPGYMFFHLSGRYAQLELLSHVVTLKIVS